MTRASLITLIFVLPAMFACSEGTSDNDKSIEQAKNLCSDYGFRDGTTAHSECVQGTSEKIVNERRERTKKFGEALQAFGQGLQGAAAPQTSNISPSTGLTCFRKGEQQSGMTKICYYDCLGSPAATTVSAVELCPLSIKR